jgi:hypothetical protein
MAADTWGAITPTSRTQSQIFQHTQQRASQNEAHLSSSGAADRLDAPRPLIISGCSESESQVMQTATALKKLGAMARAGV